MAWTITDLNHFMNSMFPIIWSFRTELSINTWLTLCVQMGRWAGSYKSTTLSSRVFSFCLLMSPWCYCVCKCARLLPFRTPTPATTSAAMTRSRFRATQMTGSTGKAHPASLCLCGHTFFFGARTRALSCSLSSAALLIFYAHKAQWRCANRAIVSRDMMEHTTSAATCSLGGCVAAKEG